MQSKRKEKEKKKQAQDMFSSSEICLCAAIEQWQPKKQAKIRKEMNAQKDTLFLVKIKGWKHRFKCLELRVVVMLGLYFFASLSLSSTCAGVKFALFTSCLTFSLRYTKPKKLTERQKPLEVYQYLYAAFYIFLVLITLLTHN